MSYTNFRLVLFVSLTIDDSGDAFPYFKLLGNMDELVTMARRSSLLLLPCGLGVRAYFFDLLTTMSGTILVVIGKDVINLMDLPSFWDNFSYGLLTVVFVRRDGNDDRLIMMVDGIYRLYQTDYYVDDDQLIKMVEIFDLRRVRWRRRLTYAMAMTIDVC